MNGFFAQISDAVNAVTILSPTSFAWFGAPARPVPAGLRAALAPAVARRLLLAALRDRLYADFYLQGGAAPTRGLRISAHPAARAAFVAALARSNSGRGQWDDGWDVLAVEPDGGLRVERDGIVLSVARGAWHAGGNAPEPGTRVRIGPLRDEPALAPGFLTLLGDASLPRDPHAPLLRYYWNCTPSGAALLANLLTNLLNRESIPFRLKVVDDPTAYARADTVVLYVEPGRHDDVAPLLAEVHARVGLHLRSAVPALTLELAPGLGLAEDPGGDESFGQQRCRVLAEGILRAWEQRRRAPEARLLAVAERFAEAGISFEAPFCNPGSPAAYPFPLAPARPHRPRAHGAREPLAVAVALGRRIAERALWSGERCTWLGAEPVGRRAPPGMPTWRTLAADLYDGTAGVGLVLAELSRSTGEANLRRVALGALRQAVATAGTLPSGARLGLYTGLPGVALACARAGLLLDDAEMLAAARRIALASGWMDPRPPHEHDLLSGSAGAIVALLLLRDLLGEGELGERAIELGERLLGAARASEHGLSWGQSARPAAPHLTGLAHGASGIGVALIALGQASGEARFGEAGLRAFAWERLWFDPAVGNWPDFRDARFRRGRPPRLLPMAAFWCHGAPGMALARLRAWQLTGDTLLLDEARAALATTRRALERELRPATLDFSLCHGLAGLAGVLLDGAAALPGEDAALALATADLGARLYTVAGNPWPCGTHTGETPGLMLGLAGIAHFYLRLHAPALPSLLLPWPGAFAG